MQCFMYVRSCPEDNHYAHPLDLVVVLDMNTKQVAPAALPGWLYQLAMPPQLAAPQGSVRHTEPVVCRHACIYCRSGLFA